jgi:internalin A
MSNGFYKYLKLNLNLASTLRGVQPLGTLFVFLLVLSCPARAILPQQITNPKTFADCCLNKANSSLETKHTIDAMLQVAKTQDCDQAEKLLSTLTELTLSNRQIAVLKFLSTLTKLTRLNLNNNPSLTNKTCPLKPSSIRRF